MKKQCKYKMLLYLKSYHLFKEVIIRLDDYKCNRVFSLLRLFTRLLILFYCRSDGKLNY